MDMTMQEKERLLSRSVRAGFSLIEIMIAIVIVGIIAGGAIYFGMTVLQSSRRTATESTLQTISLALMSYKAEKGEYPKSIPDLVNAGFLKKPVPVDAWNQKFEYKLTADGYDLFSWGPDGKKGHKASRISSKIK